MKRHGPPVGSGPSADRKLRAVGEPSHIRSEAGRASSPSPSNASTQHAAAPLRIVIVPTASRKKWTARLNDRVLCVSAWPFVMSARLLLAEGYPADTMVEMWRPNTAEWALRGRLGAVAATIIDGETASHCAKNGVPVRFPGMAVAGGACDDPRSVRPERQKQVAGSRSLGAYLGEVRWFALVLGPFLARGASA